MTETLGVPAPSAEVQFVNTGFSLDHGDSIQILLLQWQTPDPADEHGIWRTAQASEIAEKRAILQAAATRASLHRVRPMFIAAPELSLPIELIAEVDNVVGAAAKPVVVVAGLEHMTATQYAGLREKFDRSTDPIDPQTTRKVNAAAIWIATAEGARRYLQLKRGLSDPEMNDFTRGTVSYCFVSPDQHPGRRLNFAIGICADFTNRDRVLHLRREMANHPEIAALDLMFLLQMNRDQEAVQFRSAVGAYFEPPVPEAAPEATFIATSESALVFINRAAPDANPATYGRSAVHFPFNQQAIKRSDGAPTFFVDDHSGFYHHSAVFREDRPCIYFLEYVPLQRRIVGAAGTNEPPIFRSALFCDLRQLTGDELAFIEISPVIHWLLRTWECAELGIAQEAMANFRMIDVNAKSAAIASWRQSWRNAIEWWRTKLGGNDDQARRQMSILARDRKGLEPRRWHLDATVRLLLRSFLLLDIGNQRNIDVSSNPGANIEIDTRSTAFVSGRGNWTWRTAADEYYAAHRTLLDALGQSPLLVLQETAGDVPWNQTHELPRDITAPEHDNPDDITQAPRARTVRCTGTAQLYDLLCEAASFDEGAATIALKVDEVLA